MTTSTELPRPIGFIDHAAARARAIQTAKPSPQAQSLLPESSDAVLSFDGGETVDLVDLLHIALVLGTTGSGKTTSVLLPALDGLIGRGFGGLIVDVKGSMAPAVRAIAARHGRVQDVVEIGPHETAQPVNLLAGRTATQATDLFRDLFMSHAAGDARNMSFHMTGLAQTADAWQMISARGREAGVPFSLRSLDRVLNDPAFASACFQAFRMQPDLSDEERDLIQRIEAAPAHVIPADMKRTEKSVWREQVTYYLSVLRTGMKLFLDVPGLATNFFAQDGVPLDPERLVYDEKKILLLRFSPDTGDAGAGIARHVLRSFYGAVFRRGLLLPEGEVAFLVADEFQDVISTNPADNLNDASFLAKVREFRCATLLGTQSAVALAQRARQGLQDVRTILGNANVRVFLYSDEPETLALAPDAETPLDELGPGQAVLVHYDAATRTHRHSTTGVDGMHEALRPVLAGIVPRPGRLAAEPAEVKEAEKEVQKALAALGAGITAAPLSVDDEIKIFEKLQKDVELWEQSARSTYSGAYGDAKARHARATWDLVHSSHMQGEAQSTWAMAKQLETGSPVRPPDLKQAVRLYRIAASGGHAPAMMRLAEIYEAGQGVPRNMGEAERLLHAAARTGDAEALIKLAQLYERTSRRRAAARYWREAAMVAQKKMQARAEKA